MPTGTIKWFNSAKGYGFIVPDKTGADVFVHMRAVERAGLDSLREGERVSYELADYKGKTSADQIRLLGEAA